MTKVEQVAAEIVMSAPLAVQTVECV